MFVIADGTTVDSGRLLGPVILKDCKASGRFGVPLKDGTHVLHVILRAPDGTTKEVGSKPVEVDAPR